MLSRLKMSFEQLNMVYAAANDFQCRFLHNHGFGLLQTFPLTVTPVTKTYVATVTPRL